MYHRAGPVPNPRRGVGMFFYTPGSSSGIEANAPPAGAPLPSGPIAYRPPAVNTAPLVLPVFAPPSVAPQPAAASAPGAASPAAIDQLSSFLQSAASSSPGQVTASTPAPPLEGPVSNADGTPAAGGFPILPALLAVGVVYLLSRHAGGN